MPHFALAITFVVPGLLGALSLILFMVDQDFRTPYNWTMAMAWGAGAFLLWEAWWPIAAVCAGGCGTFAWLSWSRRKNKRVAPGGETDV